MATPYDNDATVRCSPAARSPANLRDASTPARTITQGVDEHAVGSRSSDTVRTTLDDAWHRGVEVIHRMENGDRDLSIPGVYAIGTDGTEVFVHDLVKIPDGATATAGDFYDLYGIG